MKAALRWTLVASILVLLGAGLYFVKASSRDGQENANCDRVEAKSVDNGAGFTVSYHTTACTTLGTSVATYIYVHPTGSSPSREHLVFSYSIAGGDDSLKIDWVDQKHVVIRAVNVGRISNIETAKDMISIGYALGQGGVTQGS